MPESRWGFTMVEIVVTVLVATILLTIAVRGFGDTMSGMAVDGARQSFASLQSRARSVAIERGDITRLNTDPAGDSVWITVGGSRVDFLNFMEDRGVDIQSGTAGVISLCMSPRGFAEVDCNSFTDNTVTLDFVQGGESASLTILPLGQLSW